MSLLLSVLLRVCSISSNAMQWQQVSVFFSAVAWYYGVNDFIIRTFNLIAHSDTVCTTCSTRSASHVTCSTDMDSRMTCSKRYGFL